MGISVFRRQPPTVQFEPAKSARKLTTLPLIAATFFMVSGGPFGLEELIHNAGYGRAVLLLAFVPVIWSVPTALMVCELSSAIPRDGGYYVWVTRALGPFWGFQEAWLSLASSIFDMALYPTIFLLYAGKVFAPLRTPAIGILAGACLILVCTVWNLSGARRVGNSAVVMGIALLAPFMIMAGMVFLHPGRWHGSSAPVPEGTLLTGVLVAMWNFMGWDNSSTIAGEVADPQRTYGRAMFGTSLLVSLVYLISVGACWRAGIDLSIWTTGAWADVAGIVGGRWLQLPVVLGGAIFGIATFNSLAMSYARVPFAMAEEGWLPKALTRLNVYGVPWVSVLACAVAWVAALSLGFVKLVELDVSIYGLSLVLEFVALIVLRIREPELARPFRVPGGLPGIILLATGPTILVILAVFDSSRQHISYLGLTFNNLLLSLCVILAGVLLGFVRFGLRPRPRPTLQ